MTLRPRRAFVGVALAAVLCAVFACASPTLPLPPPAAPSISAASLGHVKLTSTRGAEANAVIVVINRNAAVPLDARVGGALADGDGTWDAIVVASTGDVLDITQEFGSTRSAPTTVQVP